MLLLLVVAAAAENVFSMRICNIIKIKIIIKEEQQQQ
jgi:hypothetical protein